MKCIICGGPAQTWDITLGGIGADCPDCGRYDVSGSVLAVRTAGGHRFDVEQMRHWLVQQRRVYPDRDPFIQSGNERWAL